jgi:hypothetical protein
MLRADRLRRLFSILFLVACALWYWKQNVLNVLPNPGPSDFRYYYYAAQHVLHGESPFLIQDYVYPPLLALALTPVARFDYYTARWIWFIFSHACFLAAAFLLWRRIGRDWTAACVIAFVWSAGWAAQDGFPTGQPDPLLTVLIIIACVTSGWLQGAASSAGFAVKLIPAVLVLLSPLERNWRALVAFFAGAAVFMGVPWLIVAWLDGPAKPSNTDYLFGTPCVLSWSFPSVALRIFEPPDDNGKLPNDWINGWDLPRLHLSLDQKLLSLSVALAVFASGLAVLVFKTGGQLTPEQIPFAGTALVALALAASPIAWWHYQAMQYPGVALLCCAAVRAGHWRKLAAAIVCALFLFPLPAGVLRYYYNPLQRWPDAPALIYFWTSVTPIASLVLFGLLLSYLRSPRSANTQPDSCSLTAAPAIMQPGGCA